MNHTQGSALARFLRALDDAGLKYSLSGGEYEAQCANPAHDDRTPSMSVTQGRDGVIFYCHVCGDEAKPDILAALGLKESDLFDQPLDRPDRPQVVATYIYENPDGTERYRRDRREPGKDGKSKDFLQYRMINGNKVYGLKDVVRIPWRLPQVIAAVKDGDEIYWNEGEKCVQALEAIGKVATTAGGAQDWRPDMAAWLDGATKVTIIADNDEPGIKHARRVAAALKDRVRDIRIVRGAVDRPKADIVDHLAAGHTLDELVDITDEPPRLRSVPPIPPTDGTSARQPDEEPGPQPQVGFDLTATFGLRGCKIPRGYRITSHGVQHDIGKDEPVWARFTYAPLVVTAAYEDPDGEQSVELSWTDRRQQKVSRVVARDIAKRGRELVKTLGSVGLPVIESDARVAERWLAEFESANGAAIPHEKLARYLGWQPDGTFIAGPEAGTKLEVRYDEQRAPAQAFVTGGTPEGWREAIAALESYPVPRMVIAAALAALLLRPLGIDSFTLDISSRSTKGKTTALQCGCSVWANPSEGAAAISNWRGTAFAIEKRLNLVRGLPTFLDETMAVSDETIIDYLLYQLPMGKGKDRSGGYAGALPWETILLSSGERSILSYTRNQGAAARALCTTEAPFGDNGGEAARLAHDGVFANYGHAGPRFAELVRKGLAREGGLERLRLRHKALAAQYAGDSAMTGRRAPMVAVLALAEAMACETGILPYEPLPAAVWAQTFTTSASTDNQPEMAMDVVREYIAAHSFELFPGRNPEDRPPVRGWLGAMKLRDGRTHIGILPERLRGILADAGYSLDAVLGTWISAGYLVEATDRGRPTYRPLVKIDGRPVRCFLFTPLALDDDQDRGAA